MDNVKNDIKKITIIGLILNLILSTLKLVIGIVGNSQAVVADAIHSYSDLTSDFAILFGVKYWTAPPDDTHHFGHLKIESFVTIIIGVLLLLAGMGIGYNAVVSIHEKHTDSIKVIVLIGPILSIIIKEFLFRITYKVGIKINSSSVKANAWHHRTDALSSIPVLIAVILSLISPDLAFVDHIGAIIVSAFIAKVSFEIMYKSINELLDISISREEIIEIRNTIKDMKDVKGVHKIRARRLGSSIYIDFHLLVDGKLDVVSGHDISEEVKRKLIEHNPKIIDVMVHLEPEGDSPEE